MPRASSTTVHGRTGRATVQLLGDCAVDIGRGRTVPALRTAEGAWPITGGFLMTANAPTA